MLVQVEEEDIKVRRRIQGGAIIRQIDLINTQRPPALIAGLPRGGKDGVEEEGVLRRPVCGQRVQTCATLSDRGKMAGSHPPERHVEIERIEPFPPAAHDVQMGRVPIDECMQ